MKKNFVLGILFAVIIQQITTMSAFAQPTSAQDQGGVSSFWVILAIIAAAIVFMLIDKARKRK